MFLVSNHQWSACLAYVRCSAKVTVDLIIHDIFLCTPNGSIWVAADWAFRGVCAYFIVRSRFYEELFKWALWSFNYSDIEVWTLDRSSDVGGKASGNEWNCECGKRFDFRFWQFSFCCVDFFI
jgi:hypothetical protein